MPPQCFLQSAGQLLQQLIAILSRDRDKAAIRSLFHLSDEPLAFQGDSCDGGIRTVEQCGDFVDKEAGEAFHFADLVDDEQARPDMAQVELREKPVKSRDIDSITADSAASGKSICDRTWRRPHSVTI